MQTLRRISRGSLQLHVPSQSIQMIPLNPSASGDYTIAVPASTFGVMCVVRDSTTDERFDGAPRGL